MMRDALGLEKIGLKHEGKSNSLKIRADDDGDDIFDLTAWCNDAPRIVEIVPRLLVILDINETLLFRKYLPATRSYTTPKLRPFVLEGLIKPLLALREDGVIHLATWCGAWTNQRENELLKILNPLGLISKSTGRGKKK